MQYRICKKNTIRVVGVKIPLVEEHEENMLLILGFWQRTIGTVQFQQICDMAELEPYGLLGISAYFDPQHRHLGAGRYLVRRPHGRLPHIVPGCGIDSRELRAK